MLLSAPECTMLASSEVVRCGATTHTAQLDLRREPRGTAEQATRREPQLGAELRRDEKTKTRNENNSYDLHSQLKRNYSGSCGPGVRRSRRKKRNCAKARTLRAALASAYPGPLLATGSCCRSKLRYPYLQHSMYTLTCDTFSHF